MAKKRARRRNAARKRRAPTPPSPVVSEAVERLQTLAHSLDEASKEAEAVATFVREELAAEFIAYRKDDPTKSVSNDPAKVPDDTTKSSK
jgi:hypothetical protein